MPCECPICMCRLENDLGNLPCGHVMHYACLQTAFASKRECPICRAAYPQHSTKIQKLFFDCSRAATAANSSHDSSYTIDSGELEELNGRLQEKDCRIMLLEAAILEEKNAVYGLTAKLRSLQQQHDDKHVKLASIEGRLVNLNQSYQLERRHSVELQVEKKKLEDREKRMRAQLSAFSYTKDEEKLALSRKDAPKEELVALVTILKRQNAELTLQVQKLEQDVIMQEERSGSAVQLLSNIEKCARVDVGLHSTVSLDDRKSRKRARIQSAVASYVQDLAATAESHQHANEDITTGGFSALRLAKQ